MRARATADTTLWTLVQTALAAMHRFRSIYLRIAKKADVDMVWSHFFSFRKMGGMAKYLWEPLFLKIEVLEEQ